MATGGGLRLCCNTNHHQFFFDPSPPHPRSSLLFCPHLKIKTNAYAPSSSLTGNVLPPPSGRRPPMAAQSSMTSSFEEERRAARVERLWQQFFSDPSQWWDKRFDKTNPRFPDFKHKSAKKALWIDNRFSPPWVHARLAAMVRGQEEGQSGFPTREISGRVVKLEQLWQEYFSDPSQWWDNRFIKKSPKYPDFTHKTTHEGLWIEGWMNPTWIKAKMATMALGQIQSGGTMRSGVLDSSCNGDNMSKLCREGRLKEALHMMELMVQQNAQAPIKAYIGLLKVCARRKALAEGKRVHSLIVQSGFDSDIFIGNTLIYMYSKCGSELDAREVFNTMPERNVFSWTAIISAYANHGQGEEAINLFQQMQQTGIAPDKVAFVVVLKACARIAALEQGKQLHFDIIKRDLELDVILGNTLVDMYAKCGCIEQARETFNKMSERDVVSWSVMIAGYAENGLGKEALAVYEQMKQEGVQPDNVTYSILLKACASIAALEQGKQVHSDIKRSGFEPDVVVGNTLLDMYAKCGCIESAREVFSKMSERDVVSWNSMIAGYSQNGFGKEALALYEQMKQEGLQPNNVTYVILLKACSSIGALEQGKQIHSDIIRRGFESEVIVGNTLVDMYAKGGCIEHARQAFNKISEPDVVSWSTMLAGYAQNWLGKDAIVLYEQMKQQGVKPSNVTYVILLNTCAIFAALEQGKQLHADIIRSGCESDLIVGNTLVDMYAKCGCIEHAREVFDKMSERDVISWNSMIAGYAKSGCIPDARQLFNNMDERDVVSWNVMIAAYAQHGLEEEALALYEQMKLEGVQINDVTFVVLLKACASIAALEKGKQLHSHIIKSGFESDVIVGSTLIDMYAKCGCIENACEVFKNVNERDVVSWNAMIAGYTQHGLGKDALALYEQMRQEGVQPDNVTYVVLVKACASIAALEQGKQLHSDIIRSGSATDMIVGNTLVDMYAKCGCIELARHVFDKISERDLISWSAMIAGYIQQGLSKEALSLYEQMKQEGVKPDDVTYALLLKACASVAALEQGKQLHSDIIKSGFESDVIVGSALVDMYAKCGSIEYARKSFNNMHERDVVSWNAMIAGYAQQGLGKEAFTLLEQMQREGTKPNDVTYVSVLTACSHCGLVDEGCHLFDSMCKDHGVIPTMDHYACMVDLLGRAGYLADAEDLINKMPIPPDAVVWKTLMGAARNHGNVEIGRRAFNHVVKLEPENPAAYVLLSNIYAAASSTIGIANLRKEIM
ncbi:hypothetical protein O6H91_16G085100 [Diphasiastrum complanatum]|uniref:Uncharacterized protein n=1 Tax=Diphasiastrum complanatum TaxID=34168 RepID=A0ACC2BED0_DIPCM|nr:hypothetical protein O6H91_16G085100 [Diphasiastrum complanatum]